MIRLGERPLDPDAHAQLQAWQRELDGVTPFAARVEAGKERFKQRNVTTSPTYRRVRATLRAMSHGACRCAYCEHSTGDEIEHIWPKDFYPERVFDWHNYLYACGTCNGSKLNHWAPRAQRARGSRRRPGQSLSQLRRPVEAAHRRARQRR